MPRLHLVKKARASKKHRLCARCRQPIAPGDAYRWWKFRYGGMRYQHTACGPVRTSQLTQSKLADVYAAQENVEDEALSVRQAQIGNLAFAISYATDTLGEAADQATQVADGYEDAADAWESETYQTEEWRNRAEQIREWVDRLYEVQGEFQDIVEDEYPLTEWDELEIEAVEADPALDATIQTFQNDYAEKLTDVAGELEVD